MQNEFISQEAYQVARDLRCSVHTVLNAPELLYALKGVVFSPSIPNIKRAEAAIAKAEGKKNDK